MLKKSGAKYTILYASQPSGLLESPSNLPLGRYLAEEQYGECLVKSTLLEGTFVVSCYLYSVSFVVSSIMKCRLMCETILHKSIYLVSLQYCLTPFFFCEEYCLTPVYYVQGIVLLIILISGLMCMMGIDTPSRFEAPQES